MTDTFFGDYSKWNGACPADVPWPILEFRADSGYATDEQAAHYFALFKAKAHIRMAIGYVVFIPGHNAQILARLKKLFGATCPKGLTFLIDDESGSGFAGPGDHSVELNELDALLRAYVGSQHDDAGYANGSDWASTWARHRANLKRWVAKYSQYPPSGSYYGWQYSDGSGQWAVPHGYPSPHGLDMNVIHKSIEEILADFGFGTPTPAPTPITKVKGERTMILVEVDVTTVPTGVAHPGVFTFDGTTLRHVEPAVKAVSNVQAIAKGLGVTGPESITYSQYKTWGGK